MVHVNIAASAATATASSNAILSRPRRLNSGGSFHAGAPFPQLGPSPYDGPSEPLATAPSADRRRRRRRSTNPSSAHSPTRRLSTHNRYHTFPTQPPKTPSEHHRPEPIYPPFAPGISPRQQALLGHGRGGSSYSVNDSDDEDNGLTSPSQNSHPSTSLPSPPNQTPLPWKQLGLLALLSLAEQTALNSIAPYLPTMVGSFPSIPTGQEGVYVGLLASAFALAQLTTNLLWGNLSDRIGRKPVMLLGTSLLGVCFVFFGFCADYRQLLGVHVAMGLLNGNAAVVPTCLGEVTDKTNQSKAFTWLPVMYSLGSITGPALGGLLVGVGAGGDKYPFLAPNMTAAALLAVSVLVLGIWFEETLERDELGEGEEQVVTIKERLSKFGSWLGGLFGKRDNCCSNHDPASPDETQTLLVSNSSSPNNIDNKDDSNTITNLGQNPAFRQLANRTTLAVLVSYLVFQLSNISFNSLYPIFASAPPPTGRDLGPGTIGLSLSLAGLATILFQGFLFQPLKARLGNLGTYRFSLLGMAITMALMPWVGYLDEREPWWGLGSGAAWLWTELGVILVLKNICAVGGLSSVMLLITNSAPSHETLGTLQGIAQTLSAAGRSVGPFLSGGLFTLSTRVRPKGEALSWGLFAGVTLAGWAGTLLIHGKGQGLESDDWVGDDEADDEEEDGDEEEGRGGGPGE